MIHIKRIDEMKQGGLFENLVSKDSVFRDEVTVVAKGIFDSASRFVSLWNSMQTTDTEDVLMKYANRREWNWRITKNNAILDFIKYRDHHFVLSIYHRGNDYKIMVSMENQDRTYVNLIYNLSYTANSTEFRLSNFFDCYYSHNNNDGVVVIKDSTDENASPVETEMPGSEFMGMLNDYKSELEKLVYDIDNDVDFAMSR